MTTPKEARIIADMLETDIPAVVVEAFRSLASQVEALTAERDSYKKDAERYAFVRDELLLQSPAGWDGNPNQRLDCYIPTTLTLDEYVDKALAAIAKGTA